MLEPLDGERRVWEALVRPARKLKPGETLFAADGTPVVEIGGRTADGDTFTVSLVGSVDSLELLADARRDAVAAVHHRAPGRPRPLPDDLRPRAGQRGGTDRRPALHRPTCSPTLDASRRRDRQGRAGGRARHVPPDRHRRPARNTACTPSATGSRRRRCERCRRAAAVSSRSARPRCGRSSRPRSRGELEGRTDIFIHRGYDWQLVDLMMTNFHLPRTTLLMMIDAFVGERWRTPVRRGAGRGLPLPLVRRRDAARPARLTSWRERGR